jgi:hypothetical protein
MAVAETHDAWIGKDMEGWAQRLLKMAVAETGGSWLLTFGASQRLLKMAVAETFFSARASSINAGPQRLLKMAVAETMISPLLA